MLLYVYTVHFRAINLTLPSTSVELGLSLGKSTGNTRLQMFWQGCLVEAVNDRVVGLDPERDVGNVGLTAPMVDQLHHDHRTRVP